MSDKSSDRSLEKFIRNSGFKILAHAHLSSCEYGLTLYLMNCFVSGLDDVVTTESELASLMGYDDETLSDALDKLAKRKIIRLKYSDPGKSEHPSLRVCFQFETGKWKFAQDEEKTHTDAIVFPFRRQGGASLKLMEDVPHEPVAKQEEATAVRVLNSFLRGRSLDDEEVEKARNAAQTLVETHPVDQVLLMIRHFELRIPTLSLLASSWQHYQDLFEEETQKVDLLGARQKHQEQDQKLREHANAMIDRATDLDLTEEELTVLQILIKHRHPRRQLFWAYQLRSRYPNLEGFFADNANLMLAVTTGGSVVKPK